jgi:hypothetical protein
LPRYSELRARAESGYEFVGGSDLRPTADRAGGDDVVEVAELAALRLLRRQGRLGTFGDQAAFLLGQGCVEVQYEGIGIAARSG